MIPLLTPIESVPRVTPKIVPVLKRLGIHTLRDLLYHFPFRYDDLSQIKHIGDVDQKETVTLHGTIETISSSWAFRSPRYAGLSGKRMAIVEAVIRDESGSIRAVWFNQPYLLQTLKAGAAVSLSGKTSIDKKGLYLQNPSHERINPKNLQPTLHTGRLVPKYPETKGITSRWLRYLIAQHIEARKRLLDPLPVHIREQYGLMELRRALYRMHFPEHMEEANAARKRFGFEDALLIQLYVLGMRVKLQSFRAPAIKLDVELMKEFVASLPFPLTDAQRRSIWEIAKDMEKPPPMNRLLEGDVGSGKTVVAAAAALLSAKAGLQTVVMAPTEILANQHYETLSKVLKPFSVSIGLRTASAKKDRTDCDIIVGTHALIQKGVSFDRLGLIIIDEQHRFGVEQRADLIKRGARKEKGPGALSSTVTIPHFLSMSATPIPRTLALTVYSDLDISLLDEMPRSRKPVTTQLVSPGERTKAYRFIRSEVKKGRQVFVVCPRIEDETPEDQTTEYQQAAWEAGIAMRAQKPSQQKLWSAELKSVKQEHEKLSKEIFPDMDIGMLHGRMKPKEKDAVMEKFRSGDIDILVSTSVIEVGVDVPNATIMMIEGAERFGLATLHQFRGRVGRGAEQSYCLLFPTQEGMGMKRLSAILEAKNGFELAEKDLEIRGPGDFLGTQQSGMPSIVVYALANPQTARDVRKAASSLLNQSPDLGAYPELKRRLEELRQRMHGE